jgi:sugar lactone lactonase YvrE
MMARVKILFTARACARFLAIGCGLALLPTGHSQPLMVWTLAGSTNQGSANGTGAAARFNNPWGVAADSAGNIYVADTDNHTIRKITPAGIVTNFAGQPGVSGNANGTGTNALFNQPQGIAVDGSNNLYITDTGNHTIRKITSLAVVSTLAGSAGISGTNNGTGSSARFYEPEGIAVNSGGTLIYVADTWNHTIRQITSAAVVTTLAGTATTPGSADGLGLAALFNEPQGIALDGSGNLWVSDTGNQTIRKITPAGLVSTFAGTAGTFGSVNANGTNASFYGPTGIALDSSLNIYVADTLNYAIRKISPAGDVTTFAGLAGVLGSLDATASAARFRLPQGLGIDTGGNLFLADTANSTIRKISPAAVVSTFAGTASTGSTDATGSNARFYWPSGVALDYSGNAYVADTANHTIRKVTAAGMVTTLAGLAATPGTNDGPASNARFAAPQGVAVDSSGNVYVADTANHLIRKINSIGTVTTIAGGTNGWSDGTGLSAEFSSPQALAVDTSGNIFVADTGNHVIRKIASGGIVSTIAGLPGSSGNIDGTGDNTGTNMARFNSPGGIAIDGSGNLFVADTRNHTVRKVTPAGVVSTLAGLPGVPGNLDGTNNTARFSFPRGISLDPSGNIYVVDSGNHTIRQLSAFGTNWSVTTVAGSGFTGSADGTGASAQFFYPAGISINSSGLLAIADFGNNLIRAGVSTGRTSPTIINQPQSQTVLLGQSATFSVSATGTAPFSYQWQFGNAPISGATAASYVLPIVYATNGGNYFVVVTNSAGSATSALATLTVLLPGHFDTATLLAGGSIQLNMSGTPYTNYTLEYTRDWTNWQQLTTLSAPSGSFQYTDPSPATNIMRFYRLKLGGQ